MFVSINLSCKHLLSTRNRECAYLSLREELLSSPAPFLAQLQLKRALSHDQPRATAAAFRLVYLLLLARLLAASTIDAASFFRFRQPINRCFLGKL